MPDPLQLLKLSQMLGLGGQVPPQASPQAQPPTGPQPQAQAPQPNAQSSQPKGPPKPGPLEVLFPGGLNKFVESLSLLLQRPALGAPKSFAGGGIAGLNGPETVQVGEKGPEVIAPLNQGAPSNPSLMLQNILRMVLGGQKSSTPTTPNNLISINRPPEQMLPQQVPPMPGTGVNTPKSPPGGIAELIKYFIDRLNPTPGIPKMGNPLIAQNNPGTLTGLI